MSLVSSRYFDASRAAHRYRHARSWLVHTVSQQSASSLYEVSLALADLQSLDLDMLLSHRDHSEPRKGQTARRQTCQSQAVDTSNSMTACGLSLWVYLSKLAAHAELAICGNAQQKQTEAAESSQVC
jgi:hypothetical protein